MDQARADEGRQSQVGDLKAVSAVFDGNTRIGEARALARSFLTDVQAVHGLPVSERAMDVVELVVSELVTNARKHTQSPCLLTLDINDGAIEVTAWDNDPAMPTVRAPDPMRVGQHGLEIVMALCHSFEVRREPVGKRIKATVVLADDSSGHITGHQLG